MTKAPRNGTVSYVFVYTGNGSKNKLPVLCLTDLTFNLDKALHLASVLIRLSELLTKH